MNRAAQALAAAMQGQPEAAGRSPATAEGEPSGGQPGEVVDAEFRDVDDRKKAA